MSAPLFLLGALVVEYAVWTDALLAKPVISEAEAVLLCAEGLRVLSHKVSYILVLT